MEAQKSKKRELIKTIAIIFLAVLLVLTFFSNTIMNRSLPEVATGIVNSGTINAKIRGSGTISANESYEVILNQTREVRSVCVKVGDTVNQGDLLFVLGDIESQELRDAEEQLSTLQINYQKQVLQLAKTYATNDRNVQVLQEDLEKAIARRDANKVTDTDISYKKGDLATAKNESSQLALILEELNALIADDTEYQEAQAAVTELKTQISTLETTIAGYQKELEELGTSGSVDMDRKLKDAQAALTEAKNALSSAQIVYQTTYDAFKTDVLGRYPGANESNYKQYMEAYITAGAQDGDADYEKYKTAYEAISKAETTVAEKQQAYDRLVEDYHNSSADINSQRAAIQSKLNSANQQLQAANQQLQAANATLAQAENNNKAVKDQIKNYEAAKRQQDNMVTTLTDELTALQEKKTIYDEAVTAVESTEQKLEEALSGKDYDKQLNDLGLQATRLQIQKQQELVNKYREEAISTEIKANVSGTVSAINVSAGKETTAGSPMAVIDVVDRGYTIKIPVTNEQAKQVKVGDTADVSNYYWGNDVQATLESITSDPDKPGQGKLLVFRITGEIDAGSTISLSIGQRSANYDSIIPKSALREDTNGHFVLVVTAKSSPLGNRYVATRVDVQVLAEDDTNAAVTGLAQGDYVITTSSKPLEAGTLVRLVENS